MNTELPFHRSGQGLRKSWLCTCSGSCSAPTESPAIGERTVHHLEAGSNRPKLRSSNIQRRSKMRLLLAVGSIVPDSNVPSRHTRTMIFDKFKREWDGTPNW